MKNATPRKPKILVADPLDPRGMAVLWRSGMLEIVTCRHPLSESQLIEKVGDCDALIVRGRTRVTARVLQAARRLRVIGRPGAGVDNIDVAAATKRGVPVLNTPGANTVSTAEHTISLLLALARNLPQAHASMKAGRWEREQNRGVELRGKTLGIIGLGRIGKEVARLAAAFGMRVIAFDPNITANCAAASQTELVDLATLCARADFISLHVPLTEETRGMVNKKLIARMKTGVRLVNCARGGIIVERDLYDAIRRGKVAGAALDVFEHEPPPADFPLRGLDTVIMTPHLGGVTVEARERASIEIAQAVYDFLIHGIVRNPVNIISRSAVRHRRHGSA